jgi:hypothetical protein
MEILAFQPPPTLPPTPPWIERLPVPRIPAGGTILWFIGWFLKTAVEMGRPPPPRPRKFKFGNEEKENTHVVKISDCRTAIKTALTTEEVIKAIVPHLIAGIFRAIPVADVWHDLEEIATKELEKEDVWAGLVDDLVYEIAGYALSQLWQRHATKENYNVRDLLRKSRRERQKVIEWEKPPPPGGGAEPPPGKVA